MVAYQFKHLLKNKKKNYIPTVLPSNLFFDVTRNTFF